MDPEETEKYALSATIRHSTRREWEAKLGRVLFTVTRYQRLIRVTVPLKDNHLLLISLDIETKNVDDLMMQKIMPALQGRAV